MQEKYTIEQKIRVIKFYIDGVSMRSIERADGVSVPLLLHWIRKWERMVKQHLVSTAITEHAKDIAILEMDELFTYYQKNLCLACCGRKQESNY